MCVCDAQAMGTHAAQAACMQGQVIGLLPAPLAGGFVRNATKLAVPRNISSLCPFGVEARDLHTSDASTQNTGDIHIMWTDGGCCLLHYCTHNQQRTRKKALLPRKAEIVEKSLGPDVRW